MTELVKLVVTYGVPLVFVNVLLEQIGAPVPAVPTLIVAGALTRGTRMSAPHVLVAAVVASLIADWLWFLLGRRFGYRVLKTLCRISLSPDSCVRDTELRFERWGVQSLLVAKFVPGFSTVAPPLAGASQTSTGEFLLFDGMGAVLWAGAAILAGRIFHTAINSILTSLGQLGGWAALVLGAFLALIVVVKWMQRRGFYRQLRMSRVSIGELKAMIDRGEAPLIIDARSASARQRDPRRIPGAIAVDAPVPAGREIVVYCT